MRSTLDRMWHEIEESEPPAGFVVEIIDGKVIMTPQSPVQFWTITQVMDDSKAAGIDRRRIVSDVAVDFPGETSAAPDLAILDEAAIPIGKRYHCQDILAAVEVVSTRSDKNDYVTKVEKYARFGIESYLIIDPFRAICTLHHNADATGYRRVTEHPYGEKLELPLLNGVSVTINTSEFDRED